MQSHKDIPHAVDVIHDTLARDLVKNIVESQAFRDEEFAASVTKECI